MPDLIDAECLPARPLLRSPERGALAAAERRILREQHCEALLDDGQHLRLRGRRPEIEEPLQRGRRRTLLCFTAAKLAPKSRVLDSQVRELRLQGAELVILAQQLALVRTPVGDERRLL